jgi:hypothetical protein
MDEVSTAVLQLVGTSLYLVLILPVLESLASRSLLAIQAYNTLPYSKLKQGSAGM